MTKAKTEASQDKKPLAIIYDTLGFDIRINAIKKSLKYYDVKIIDRYNVYDLLKTESGAIKLLNDRPALILTATNSHNVISGYKLAKLAGGAKIPVVMYSYNSPVWYTAKEHNPDAEGYCYDGEDYNPLKDFDFAELDRIIAQAQENVRKSKGETTPAQTAAESSPPAATKTRKTAKQPAKRSAPETKQKVAPENPTPQEEAPFDAGKDWGADWSAKEDLRRAAAPKGRRRGGK